MNSRRRFFKSLVKAAAIVALAPQIAFRVKPLSVAVEAVPKVETVTPFWLQTTRYSSCVDDEYLKMYRRIMEDSKGKAWDLV